MFKPQKVLKEKSKIKFEIILTGCMDWNKDFCCDNPLEEKNILSSIAFKIIPDFNNSILNYIGINIKRSPLISWIFEEVTLKNIEVSNEVLEQYKLYKEHKDTRQELEIELQEIEKRADIIRKKISKL